MSKKRFQDVSEQDRQRLQQQFAAFGDGSAEDEPQAYAALVCPRCIAFQDPCYDASAFPLLFLCFAFV